MKIILLIRCLFVVVVVQRLFVWGQFKQTQIIFDQRQEIKSMVINMLYNENHMYYSHNNNIEYIDLTIKCISFI